MRPALRLAAAALPGAALVLTACLGFAPTVRDLPSYFVPLRQRTAEVLAGARGAFWDPDVGCGEPYFANPQSGLLYPPAWLATVLPPAVAVGVEAGLHLAILAVGCALLARRLGAGRVARGGRGVGGGGGRAGAGRGGGPQQPGHAGVDAVGMGGGARRLADRHRDLPRPCLPGGRASARGGRCRSGGRPRPAPTHRAGRAPGWRPRGGAGPAVRGVGAGRGPGGLPRDQRGGRPERCVRASSRRWRSPVRRCRPARSVS